MFGKLFSKKPTETTNNDYSEFDSLKKEYMNLDSNINYLKSSWNKYILSSLNSEFELFKNWVSQNTISDDSDNKFWTVCDISSSRFTISRKKDKTWQSIRIYVRYDFDDTNFNLEIKSALCGDIDLKMTKEMKGIISKYFLTTMVENKKRYHSYHKKSFDDMKNLIGKDLIRDERIDDILKNL